VETHNNTDVLTDTKIGKLLNANTDLSKGIEEFITLKYWHVTKPNQISLKNETYHPQKKIANLNLIPTQSNSKGINRLLSP
jgi:hypothetical protein